MKRTVITSLALLALVIPVFKFWQVLKEPTEVTTASATPTTIPSQTVQLNVGLNQEEAALWHHRDEGSG